MHGNLNHIGQFVNQVQQNYHKHYVVKNGGGDYVRPVAMLIVWRFTGIRRYEIARYFNCTISSLNIVIKHQLGYEETKDPSFIKHYNQLLDLYIASTKFYIRKKKFIQ